ncbi:MAG TPA: serine/threonine-protein kinase, partial [Byssovorax sp.]
MSSPRSEADSGVPSAARSSRREPKIAGYDLVRVIGKGGMGVVWEAHEHRLDRAVALKLCTGEPKDEHVQQLWSEARLAAKIGHPGVVPVHDFGYTADGRPYYTMDLVAGTDLCALLDDGPLPVPRALGLALEMAEAVAAAHERGVLHRDLKPSNILLDGSGRVRILDFGLAVLDTDAHDPRKIAGSPPYMAPERFMQKPPTAASDVYALGIVLYEMLVGDRPFEAFELHEVMYALLNSTPKAPSERRPGVHADVDDVVMRAIAKEPTARWPTARGLAEALRAVTEGRPLESTRGPETARPPSRRAPPPRFDRSQAKTYVEVTLDLRASA